MNRIYELAKEAGMIEFDAIPGFNVVTPDHTSVVKAQKFAELIVRECMLCCERVISDPVRPESVDTWLNGGLSCINEIKEHFGVK